MREQPSLSTPVRPPTKAAKWRMHKLQHPPVVFALNAHQLCAQRQRQCKLSQQAHIDSSQSQGPGTARNIEKCIVLWHAPPHSAPIHSLSGSTASSGTSMPLPSCMRSPAPATAGGPNAPPVAPPPPAAAAASTPPSGVTLLAGLSGVGPL